MSDYSETGAVPVEDAAVDHPPTEAEVLAAQERDYPDQAARRMGGGLDRQPDDGQMPSDPEVQAERQAEGEAAEYGHE